MMLSNDGIWAFACHVHRVMTCLTAVCSTAVQLYAVVYVLGFCSAALHRQCICTLYVPILLLQTVVSWLCHRANELHCAGFDSLL